MFQKLSMFLIIIFVICFAPTSRTWSVNNCAEPENNEYFWQGYPDANKMCCKNNRYYQDYTCEIWGMDYNPVEKDPCFEEAPCLSTEPGGPSLVYFEEIFYLTLSKYAVRWDRDLPYTCQASPLDYATVWTLLTPTNPGVGGRIFASNWVDLFDDN